MFGFVDEGEADGYQSEALDYAFNVCALCCKGCALRGSERRGVCL